jgi:probable selenium-dependent hydroxylase accessory protein YqeC
VVPASELGTALDLGPHEHIAVVGAGGKTTIAHALARHLAGQSGGQGARRGGRCLLTTTTKMGFDQAQGLPVLLSPTDAAVAAVETLTVVWRAIDEPVALGVDAGQCDRWFGLVDHVVVEADGARRRPFKAPAPHEPVVPASASLVVLVIGADALGAPIDERCHRPERVAALAGCDTDDILTPERAALVLTHPHGYRAAVPPGARLVVAATKVGPEQEPLVAVLGAALAAAGAELAVTLPFHPLAPEPQPGDRPELTRVSPPTGWGGSGPRLPRAGSRRWRRG